MHFQVKGAFLQNYAPKTLQEEGGDKKQEHPNISPLPGASKGGF